MIIIGVVYFLSYNIRQYSDGILWIQFKVPSIDSAEFLIYSTISACIFLLIGIIQKRYSLVDIGLESKKKFLSVRGQRTIIITCMAYFGQWFIFEKWISRLIIIWTAGASIVLIPLADALWKRLYISRMKQFSHSILILYRETEQAQQIIQDISLPSYYNIRKKIFSWQLSDLGKTDIVLLVWSYTQDELQSIVDNLRLKNIQLYHIGDNHFLEDIVYTPTKIGWIRALRYKATELEWWSALIKRIFDIIVGSIMLILLSPLMILTALIIRLTTFWPALYIQDRIGRNGAIFHFIKFRSMYTHLSVGKEYGWGKAAEIYQRLINSRANIRKGELAKIENDPRVTSLGRFIRATSLDELPNLFSVIKWDMSLIGPRPHLPNEIAQYKPRQKRVLSVKPGITGYAQIHGRDSLSFDEEATKELEYIQNRSLRLDIYILFATIGVLFWGRGK
jgi:lipopolysaccharide/colanic/teichoic acid biosynthesis glycosyltransferase